MYYKAEFAKFHALMPYVPFVLVFFTLVPYVPNMPFYSHAWRALCVKRALEPLCLTSSDVCMHYELSCSRALRP